MKDQSFDYLSIASIAKEHLGLELTITSCQSLSVNVCEKLIESGKLDLAQHKYARSHLERLRTFYNSLYEGGPDYAFLDIFYDFINIGAIDYKRFYLSIIDEVPKNSFLYNARLFLEKSIFNLLEFTISDLDPEFLHSANVIDELKKAKQQNKRWIVYYRNNPLSPERISYSEYYDKISYTVNDISTFLSSNGIIVTERITTLLMEIHEFDRLSNLKCALADLKAADCLFSEAIPPLLQVQTQTAMTDMVKRLISILLRKSIPSPMSQPLQVSSSSRPASPIAEVVQPDEIIEQEDDDPIENFATSPEMLYGILQHSTQFEAPQWQRLKTYIEQNLYKPSIKVIKESVLKLQSYLDDSSANHDLLNEQFKSFFAEQLLAEINQQYPLTLTRKDFNKVFSEALQHYRSSSQSIIEKKSTRPNRGALDNLIIDFFIAILKAHLYERDTLNHQALLYAELVYRLFTDTEQEMLEHSCSQDISLDTKYTMVCQVVCDNFKLLKELYNVSPIRDTYFFNNQPTVLLIAMIESLGISMRRDQVQVDQNSASFQFETMQCDIVFSTEVDNRLEVLFKKRLIEETSSPVSRNTQSIASSSAECSQAITFGEEILAILQAELSKEQPDALLTSEMVQAAYSQLLQNVTELTNVKNEIDQDLQKIEDYFNQKKNKPNSGKNLPQSQNLGNFSKERRGALRKSQADYVHKLEELKSTINYLQFPKETQQPKLHLILDLIRQKVKVAASSPTAQVAKLPITEYIEEIILDNVDEAIKRCSMLTFPALSQLLDKGEFKIRNKRGTRIEILKLEFILSNRLVRESFLMRCQTISSYLSWEEVKSLQDKFKESSNELRKLNIWRYFPITKEYCNTLADSDYYSFAALFEKLTNEEWLELATQLYAIWQQFSNSDNVKKVWGNLITILCQKQDNSVLNFVYMLYLQDQLDTGKHQRLKWFVLAEIQYPVYENLITTLLERYGNNPVIIEVFNPIIVEVVNLTVRSVQYSKSVLQAYTCLVQKACQSSSSLPILDKIFCSIPSYRLGKSSGWLSLACLTPETSKDLVEIAFRLNKKEWLDLIIQGLNNDDEVEQVENNYLGWMQFMDQAPKAYEQLIGQAISSNHTEILLGIIKVIFLRNPHNGLVFYLERKPEIMSSLIDTILSLKLYLNLDLEPIFKRILPIIRTLKPSDKAGVPGTILFFHTPSIYKLLFKWIYAKYNEKKECVIQEVPHQIDPLFKSLIKVYMLSINPMFIQPITEALSDIEGEPLDLRMLAKDEVNEKDEVMEGSREGEEPSEDVTKYGRIFVSLANNVTFFFEFLLNQACDDQGELFNIFINYLEAVDDNYKCSGWLMLASHLEMESKAYPILVRKALENTHSHLFNSLVSSLKEQDKNNEAGWTIVASNYPRVFEQLLEQICADQEMLSESFFSYLETGCRNDSAPSIKLAKVSIESYLLLVRKACEPKNERLRNILIKDLKALYRSPQNSNPITGLDMILTYNANGCIELIQVVCQLSQKDFVAAIIEDLTERRELVRLRHISRQSFVALIMKSCELLDYQDFKSMIDGFTKYDDLYDLVWIFCILDFLPEDWELLKQTARKYDNNLLIKIENIYQEISLTSSLSIALSENLIGQTTDEKLLEKFLDNLERKQHDTECLGWIILKRSVARVYEQLIQTVIEQRRVRLLKICLTDFHVKINDKQSTEYKTGWEKIAEYSSSIFKLLLDYVCSDVELLDFFVSILDQRAAIFIGMLPSIDLYKLLIEKACEPNQTALCELITRDLKFIDIETNFTNRWIYLASEAKNNKACETIIDIACQSNNSQLIKAIVECSTYNAGWWLLASEYRSALQQLIAKICEPQNEDLLRLMIDGLQKQRDMGCEIGWMAFTHYLPEEVKLITISAARLNDDDLMTRIDDSIIKADALINSVASVEIVKDTSIIREDFTVCFKGIASSQRKEYLQGMANYLARHDSHRIHLIMYNFLQKEKDAIQKKSRLKVGASFFAEPSASSASALSLESWK